MSKLAPLTFNDPAPDLELSAATGEAVRLSSLWSQRLLLLAFTRHFGCTQCKEMLDHITAARAQLAEAAISVAVVTQGTPEAALEFCGHYAPGWLCLADPERKAYAAFGLERGNLYQTVLSPKVWRGVAAAGKKGYRLEPPPPGQDALQMAGTFIIGPDGRVRLPYYYTDIADHPSLALLLKGVLGTRWDKPLDGPLGSD